MTTNEDIVVVAVDGSPAAENAVRWAANTANKRGIPLQLATSYTMPQFLYAEGMVPPQELFDDLQAEALNKVDDARRLAHEVAPEIKIGHTIVEGSPIDMLLEISKTATMIVMGSRGLGGLSGMVMGSVSAAVVSHAECPVVVGVDGSDVSQQATEVAFAEAEARGAELVAVHTWMDMQMQSSLAGVTAAQADWAEIEKQQITLLEERIQPLVEKYPGVQVKKIITRDRPVRALSEQSDNAQLLVVGSHGRGGFKGMLIGSTSRALLQSAPCPLMVVRPGTVS
ncbi:MAG TPA: universal stress protein [Corynebacterium sp.]|nr:universal stress protein [Corynebacterium sp.]